MARSDRKRKPSRNLLQKKRLLVVVEGAVTEKQYLEAVRRSRRLGKEAVAIETGHTDPIGIVRTRKRSLRRLVKVTRTIRHGAYLTLRRKLINMRDSG